MPTVPGLPPVGVRAVVQNQAQFVSGMSGINRAIQQTSNIAKQAASQTAHHAASLSDLASSVAPAIAAFGILTIAIAGVVAALSGLVALAVRGSTFTGIIASFDALTASVDRSASKMLGEFRRASGSMITDIEAMRLANFGLAGATGEFGRQLGRDLPKLMEIARVSARGTGRDFTQLFQALVTGVKRSSPLLIDNTGLVIKIGEANQAYADSIGKNVEQLTAEEEQIALLNATLEAGMNQVELLGNIHETAAEKIQRAGAVIGNMLDVVALNLQPAFEYILDIINTVLIAIEGIVQSSAVYIQAISTMVVDALKPVFESVSGWAEGMNSQEAARAFFTGAANTFGSFLKGVYQAGTWIIYAVKHIAQAIADLLLGSSPPPKGPLHNMITGAENTMLAWIEGFTGVSLQPIADVAQAVVDLMGPIATMSLAQVETRLAELDAAIKPFQDRVTIIRAQFDAITKISDIALGRVDRQLTTAVQALLRGENGSDAVVRRLDAQRQSIEEAVAVQQDQLEGYELQLAIMEAIQAQERAMLNIRKDQIPPVKDVAAVLKKEKKDAASKAAKEDKEDKGSGKEELPPGEETPDSTRALENLFQFKPGELKAAKAEMEAAFKAGLGGADVEFQGALDALGGSNLQLQKGINAFPSRIQKIFDDAFSGLPLSTQKHLIALGDHISNFMNNTLPTLFSIPPEKLGGAIAFTVGGAILLAFASNNLVSMLTGGGIATLLSTAISNAIPTLTLTISNIGFALGSTKYFFVTAVAPIATQIGTYIATAVVAAGVTATLAAVALAIGAFVFAVNYDVRAAIFKFLTEKIGFDPFAMGIVLNVNPTIEALTGQDALFQSLSERIQSTITASGPVPVRVYTQVEMQEAADEAGYEIREEVTAPKRLAEQIGKTIKDHFPDELQKVMKGDTTIGSSVGTLVSTQVATLDFTTLFSPLILGIQTFITAQGDPSNVLGLVGFFTALPLLLVTALATFGPTLKRDLFGPANIILEEVRALFKSVFSGDVGIEGSIDAAIQSTLDYITLVPGLIGAALQPTYQAMVTSFINPIITGLNIVLTGFEQTMQELARGIETFLRDLGIGFDGLGTAGLLDPALGVALRQASTVLRNTASSFSIGRVPLQGAAKGGVFGPGLLKVGERGQEIVGSAQRMAVFPNRFLRAVENLTGFMTSSVPMVSPNNVSTTNNYDRSMNFGDIQFGGSRNDVQAAQRIARMRALG